MRHHFPSSSAHSSRISISTSPAFGSSVWATRVTTARLELGTSETDTIRGLSMATRLNRSAWTLNSLIGVVARYEGSNISYMPATSPRSRADHHACTRRSRSAASGAGAGLEHATNATVSSAASIKRSDRISHTVCGYPCNVILNSLNSACVPRIPRKGTNARSTAPEKTGSPRARVPSTSIASF